MSQATEVEVSEVVKKNKSKAAPVSDVLSPVGIRLGEDLRASVEAEADEQGVTLGELCRQFIEEGMKHNPDRQHMALVRSLAITEAQLKRAAESLPEDQRRYFSVRGKRFRAALEAVEELREELEAKR